MSKSSYKGYTLRNIGNANVPYYGVFNKGGQFIDALWFQNEFESFVDKLLN